MQPTRRTAFWVLLGLVGGAGFALLAAVLVFNPPELWAFVVSAFVAGALQRTQAYLNTNTKVSLSVVVLFFCIAYGGLPLVVTVGAVSGLLVGFSVQSDRFIKGVYNAGMDILAYGFAAWVFAFVVDLAVIEPSADYLLARGGLFAFALLCAGLAYTVANSLLMAGVLWSTSGVPFAVTLRTLLRDILLLQSVYVGLAAIAYVVMERVGGLALLLVGVPLLVARQAVLSVQERQEAFDRMVGAFVETIQAKDGYTRGHAERVSDLSVRVAERMGLSYEDRELIRYGAILHDVGKVGVSLGILCKAGPLTDDEFDEMKRHPDIGADILEDIDFLQPALAIVRHHHERMDGRGYPAGLASGEIPLLTRVVTAVDAFDAMTSTRSYRRALPVEVAIHELQHNAGTQFDAEVVEHLVAVIEQDGWTLTDEPVAVSPPIMAARS